MRQILTSLFLLLSFVLLGQKNIHEQWTSTLKIYLDSEANVNYVKLKNDTTALDNYISSLEDNPPAE